MLNAGRIDALIGQYEHDVNRIITCVGASAERDGAKHFDRVDGPAVSELGAGAGQTSGGKSGGKAKEGK